MTFSRAEIGARQQGLETLQTRLEDEEIELKESLSNEINTDLAEAISNLTSRQAALQARCSLWLRLRNLLSWTIYKTAAFKARERTVFNVFHSV